MRVLGIGKFYPPEYHGGLESVVAALNAELVKRGCDVTCVVAAVRGAGGTSEVDGVRVVRARSLGTVLSQPVAPGLVTAVRREAGDLLHLHHPNPLGDLAALVDRRPLVISHHSDVVRQRALRPFYGPLLRRAYARARAVVVASENYRGASRELAGLGAKVRVVPYGIDVRRFDLTTASADRALALRAAWGGKPVVLAVGRLVGYKGFDVLLRAVAGLEVTTVIVGAGPEEARLKSLAPPGVVFEGRVSDAELPAWYHACDVFCLPSLTIAEAFGVVLLEAAACGKPLVTTALPTGVTAVNRDGVTGLAVPVGDAGALREALRALVGDAARRQAMGLAGRRAVEKEYTTALMADRYLALFREVLG